VINWRAIKAGSLANRANAEEEIAENENNKKAGNN
jgi:hypothetical protein